MKGRRHVDCHHKAKLFAALLGLAAIASGAASAQGFPSGTVKLIVPVPAGGVTDTMARIVAQRLSEAWGQSVVVDNRPGGNYAVGAQAVARSPADGLTSLRFHRHRQSASHQQAALRSGQGSHAHHRAVPDHAGHGDHPALPVQTCRS